MMRAKNPHAHDEPAPGSLLTLCYDNLRKGYCIVWISHTFVILPLKSTQQGCGVQEAQLEQANKKLMAAKQAAEAKLAPLYQTLHEKNSSMRDNERFWERELDAERLATKRASAKLADLSSQLQLSKAAELEARRRSGQAGQELLVYKEAAEERFREAREEWQERVAKLERKITGLELRLRGAQGPIVCLKRPGQQQQRCMLASDEQDAPERTLSLWTPHPPQQSERLAAWSQAAGDMVTGGRFAEWGAARKTSPPEAVRRNPAPHDASCVHEQLFNRQGARAALGTPEGPKGDTSEKKAQQSRDGAAAAADAMEEEDGDDFENSMLLELVSAPSQVKSVYICFRPPASVIMDDPISILHDMCTMLEAVHVSNTKFGLKCTQTVAVRFIAAFHNCL
jgi:hypothetical protein